MSDNPLRALERFSACDISDALLKLKVPQAGFIPDLHLQNSTASNLVRRTVQCANINTVLFAPKSHSEPTFNDIPQNTNIPADSHYVDHTPAKPGHAICMSAPSDANCAVLGGIMAMRMFMRGTNAIIVDGRVRDLAELRGMSIPIWSTGTSTVGAGEGTKVWARDVPIDMGGVKVEPGDVACVDPEENGVVVIPKDLVEQVLELCPKLTEADAKVIKDVSEGGTVKEAFAKHRKGL